MSVLTGVFFFEPVALLAEGVDRNIHSLMPPLDGFGSPSSRRAWIEIAAGHDEQDGRNVALLAEGVDRNDQTWTRAMPIYRSPSSRRAWIEIDGMEALAPFCSRRPPRGGRG